MTRVLIGIAFAIVAFFAAVVTETIDERFYSQFDGYLFGGVILAIVVVCVWRSSYSDG